MRLGKAAYVAKPRACIGHQSENASGIAASASPGRPPRTPMTSGSADSESAPGKHFDIVQTASRLRNEARESHQIGLESSAKSPNEILIGTSTTKIAANERNVYDNPTSGA